MAREQPRSRCPCLHRERRHESAPVDRVHLTSDETAYLPSLRRGLPCPLCFRGKDSAGGSPAPRCHAPLLFLQCGGRGGGNLGFCQYPDRIAARYPCRVSAESVVLDFRHS